VRSGEWGVGGCDDGGVCAAGAQVVAQVAGDVADNQYVRLQAPGGYAVGGLAHDAAASARCSGCLRGACLFIRAFAVGALSAQ